MKKAWRVPINIEFNIIGSCTKPKFTQVLVYKGTDNLPEGEHKGLVSISDVILDLDAARQDVGPKVAIAASTVSLL
jgi:hypothetical protein